MFETLSERLTGALQRVTGRGRITEDNIRDTVRQIRMALLEAPGKPQMVDVTWDDIDIGLDAIGL